MTRANHKQICFPPFRLDGPEQRLYRNDELVPLRPKSFEVLQYLSERPGKLVTKEEILEVVWPNTTVTDTVLKVCIREIRDALGDHAARSRFIETAHRRGYRFIAKIEDEKKQEQPIRSHTAVVGRDEEIAILERFLEKALNGERQLIFVTGEPGIGKTTLVQSFLERAARNADVLIADGQCLEQYGSSEAYLPMLEAVSRLCREPGSEPIIALLRRQAPTWLAQIPWLASSAASESEALGATRERMLREMAEAIEAITVGEPLILVLEDLHWSDYSTLDLVAYLARRRERSRLMVIGTYRPAEVVSGRHPLNALKQELQAHRQCEVLPVKLLDEEEVAEHLAVHFPRNQFPSHFARAIHQRTDGNPMFVIHLIDFFLTKGLIAQVGDEWVLTEAFDKVELGMPDNIRQIIEKQVGNLSDNEQRVLETASIAGVEFSLSTIAAALEQDHFEVEETCEKLAKRHLFIRAVGTVELRQDEMSARYAFIHALYQNALYERVPVARRARVHKKIAEHIETMMNYDTGGMAAELAMHFEQAHDYRRAVRYLQQAAENASHRSANHEAATLSRRGLELLARVDDRSEHTQELLLQIRLAHASSATQGYGATEVEEAYRRARKLCRQSGSNIQLAPVLWGLWRFYLIRSDLKLARDLSQQLLELAQSAQDSALLVGAHLALGTTFNNLGDFEPARNHFEQGLSLYDPQQQTTYLSLYGSDPSVTHRCFNAWALWSLGYPDLALVTAREAISLAEELRHPETHCFATFFNAWVHQLRREPDETLKYARATIELARKNGIAQWIAFGSSLRGWAVAEQGLITEGIEEMRKTLAAYNAIGSEISRPHFLGLLAEALTKDEQLDEGLLVLSEALKVVDNTDQRYYESELHRLKGELLRQRGDEEQAQLFFQKSIEVARKQKARSFELRAATSLIHLSKKATSTFVGVYNSFTEGFDTADLKNARALLDTL